MDLSIIKQQWLARGFSCERWVDPPGTRWENFVHEVDELLMVLEGEIEIEIQGKVFHPTAGEEVFIPAQINHSVRNIGESTSLWLYGYHSKV